MKATTTQTALTREYVLKKCTYFRDVGLWPRADILSPERWLANFGETESPHALHLLNAFTYINEDLTNELFIASFQAISGDLFGPGSQDNLASWQHFVDRVLVTPVEGEDPNPTDSGYGFARRARQIVKEPRIGRPGEIVARLAAQDRPVVFVDDFVGSGNQFIETWQRKHRFGSLTSSFEDLAKARSGPFYYCPIICTEYGKARIQRECPEVRLVPAHLMRARDGALASDSRLWPEHLRATAETFMQEASRRAGYVGADWRGFHELGLALAFAHSVPDATLPLFYSERNGWRPLIRRT